MTHEQRLDRLERIAKLMVRSGLKARRQSREQDGKINIIIDSQIKNEERFAALAQAQTELAQAQTELAQSQAKLAEGHAETGDRLNALIAMFERYIAGRNGSA